jgi:parallel beta-helix repeat protein
MKNSLYLRSGILVLVLLAAIPAALGATSITGPTVISSPGTYVLAKDIAGGNSPAIWVKSSGVTIDGNGHTIRGGGGGYGILVNKDGTTLTGVAIKNVRVENWNCGIYFKGVASSTASGVTAVSNGKAGINLRTTRGTTISGCTVTGNQQGILLWQDCDGNTIAGNTMKDNSDMGLWMAGTGRTSSGIVYDSTGNTVSGNTATGNRYGLYLDFTRDNIVTGNRAANNRDHGIFLDYSSGNRVTNNVVTGHSQSGFVLFDSARCTISGNTASGNGDYGLWAIDSSSLSISNNQFSGNAVGTFKLSGTSSQTSGSTSQTSGGATLTTVAPTQAPAVSGPVTNSVSGSTPSATVVTTTTQAPSGSADITATPTTAPKGAAVKFTVKPTAGKTIQSVWWSFDADKHLNTWNSRATSPTFFYPATGTFSPLVKITYTDNSVEEVKKSLYVKVT